MSYKKGNGDCFYVIRNALSKKARKFGVDDKRNEQITQHYIYNSLQVIAGMCDTDPVKAKASIIAFAEYLRFNLDNVMAKNLSRLAGSLSIRGYILNSKGWPVTGILM